MFLRACAAISSGFYRAGKAAAPLLTGCILYLVYTIEQTSNKRRANVFTIHVLIARRLLGVC